jgi:polysaccharide export outer membrane protein
MKAASRVGREVGGKAVAEWRRVLVLGLVFAATLLTPIASPAQAPVPFQTPKRLDKITPADLLAAFEAPLEEDYALGEGDEVSVDVGGRAELSGSHLIGPDGNITLPYVGEMHFAGLTRTAAAKAALTAWNPLYDSLFVTVKVTKYESNKIFVLGRVASPGVLHFDVQPTLLEAVTRAGGLPIGGIGADKAALARCMVFRGKDKLVWIDLRSLLNGSNLALNIRLERNDTLYIPDSDDQLVYVMGEVKKPGAIGMTPNMTFLTALAQAGGPTDDAKKGRIRLIRPSAGLERDFDLDEFYRGGSNPNVTLQDGDILYVARSKLGTIGYVLGKMTPLTGFLLFTTSLAQ